MTPAERPRSDRFAATAAAVAEFSGSRTLILVVDDLQWADTASVRLLEQLLDVVAGLRVIATARTVDMDAPEVGAMLARLRTTDRAVFLSLTGLDLPDVAAALGEHGVDAPDTHARARGARRNRGQPALRARDRPSPRGRGPACHRRPTVRCSTRSGCRAGSRS